MKVLLVRGLFKTDLSHMIKPHLTHSYWEVPNKQTGKQKQANHCQTKQTNHTNKQIHTCKPIDTQISNQKQTLKEPNKNTINPNKQTHAHKTNSQQHRHAAMQTPKQPRERTQTTKHTDKQTNKQTHKRTNKQTNKQTDK